LQGANESTLLAPTNSNLGSKAGLAARRLAVALIEAVLKGHQPFDEAFERLVGAGELDGRDRAFVHALAAVSLRRLGEAKAVIAKFLTKPLPKSSGMTETILLIGAAQLLFLSTPVHAAIDQSVELAKEDRDARHFAGLINAVLRRVDQEGRAVLGTLDAARLNTPAWLMKRWTKTYGADTARAIAASHVSEPAIDISVKLDAELWAERLGGRLLESGGVRLPADAGRIEALPGYDEGAWWVQDMAASLPAQLLGDVRGKRVLDLCAAPGGKTAQLAAAGAIVTSVDDSGERVARLKQNMARLRLDVDVKIADALTYTDKPYDAVLLDAPCSATGTIRRHPDLPYLKSAAQIAALAKLQTRMLANAARLVEPGGLLVYCSCSLEPEECEERVAAFLQAHPDFARLPVAAAEVGYGVTGLGDLRTLPCQDMDGFYAAQLIRGR
jgi:16S rRNA (cytosine967-C5)-methyltransferase